MEDKVKSHTVIQAMFLALLLGGTALSVSAQSKSQDNPYLFLILDNGFLHGELIKINLECDGMDTTIFAGSLSRKLWTNDHTFFKMPLTSNKTCLLRLLLVSRDVTFEQGLRLDRNDIYLELGVDMRNRIHSVISDHGGRYN